MRTRTAARDLTEQGLLNDAEILRLDDVQYLLNLAKKHDLLLRASLGPKAQQATNNLLGKAGVLLQKLNDAVGELSMVQH